MLPRHAWVIVVLALVAPLLAFPHSVGPDGVWLPAVIAVCALILGTWLLRDFGKLSVLIAVLALAAVLGWWRSPNHWAALNHFCGLALGILTMSAMAVSCRTRPALTIGALTFLAFGCVALAAGFRSVAPVGNKVMGETVAFGPQHPLPMPAWHSRTGVNPNALAATAVMILPLAVAAALAPVRFGALGNTLRLTGVLAAVGAATLVLLMQSRSAWLAAVFVLWLVARRWMRPTAWWLVAAILFLALPAALIMWREAHPRLAAAVDSLAVHREIWASGLEALRSSPWLGIGFDYFRESGFPVFNATHAHNIAIQTILDLGFAGAAAYFAVIAFVLYLAHLLARARGGEVWLRYLGAGAALSIVAVHIFGALDAVPLGAKVGIFQWWSSGLILAAWRLEEGVVESHRVGHEPARAEALGH